MFQTMHLVCLCLEGRPLPQTLPLNLIPPNKRGSGSEPLAIMPPPSLTSFSYTDLCIPLPSSALVSVAVTLFPLFYLY